MSKYEMHISRLCYEHYKNTGSKEFTYIARNGDDMVLAHNATESLKECGYISGLTSSGPFFTFVIEDSLILYMKQAES